MLKRPIRYFNNKPVRAVWDNADSLWWYSAVDFITILVEPNSPRRYWNNVKVRNPELSPFCGQLKLYADDGKKYLSDVINEEGVRLLLTIIPSKYKKAIQDWIKGLLDPIDEQSKKKAYDFYKTELVEEDEIGKTVALQKIHGYLFEGLYPFAGKIRTKTISKDGFIFANGDFILEVLKDIDKLPDNTFDEIVDKYIEMNIAHPFMEGNGRATRIWLDLLLKNRLKKCIDWSKINKDKYLSAMKVSPVNPKPIFSLLKEALTNDINNRDIFMKGIDYSYYYEEE
ncbi:MAG: Fic family protein [Bacillales bacterium]|nr:Fic family protein [Bacillales bacterium]MDY6003751.1 Fic family protein [Bacilli bacterium]